MLDVVYRFELEELKPYVEALDFDSALRTVRRFVDEGGVEPVRAAFGRCIDALPPETPFPVYPIIGIGHANGMALPAVEPYVFIGLERYSEVAAGLDGLIVHGCNHLFRAQAFDRRVEMSSLCGRGVRRLGGRRRLLPDADADRRDRAPRPRRTGMRRDETRRAAYNLHPSSTWRSHPDRACAPLQQGGHRR